MMMLRVFFVVVVVVWCPQVHLRIITANDLHASSAVHLLEMICMRLASQIEEA